MKHNIDISIDVHDENRIKSIRHEKVSGNDELQLLQNFILMFHRIINDIKAQEAFDEKWSKVADDDIPF